MTPEERYRLDPLFHRLVHTLAELLACEGVPGFAPRLTVDDVKAAANIAQELYERRRARRVAPVEERLRADWYPPPNPNASSDWLGRPQSLSAPAFEQLAFRTRDHPEANGRIAGPGDRLYRVELALEDGRALSIEFGAVARRQLETFLLHVGLQDVGTD